MLSRHIWSRQSDTKGPLKSKSHRINKAYQCSESIIGDSSAELMVYLAIKYLVQNVQ